MTQSTVEYPKIDSAEIIKTAPIRVLHVDDDISFLKTAKPILEMQGAFQVDTASSVEEATEKMKENKYDVVISDYQMPGKDGLQFLKELRNSGNNISFVIITGKGREEAAIKALNLGADGYFNKLMHPETAYGELAHGIKQIVEKKRSDQMLLKSEDKYRRLVETLREGIWVIDKDSCTTFVNPSMAEMLGYGAEEMKGKHLFSFMDERGVEIAKRLLERRKQGINEQHDFEFLRKDGKRIYATLETSPITDDNGNYIGALAGVIDITERKKAEESLNSMMNQLAMVNEKLGVVGNLTRHDIRNKLAAVLNNIYLTKKTLTSNHEALKYLGEIESVFDQVGKIFEFARIYEILGTEELCYVDVSKSVDEAVMLFSDLHGAKVVNDCQGLTVLADSLVRQLFYNLIDDSLKYGEKVSQIRVYYEKVGDGQLKLVYEDD
ncbi:PAS domain S-box protein, partial [Candidatus Bathyarchaeota archaeon]|nr:PAS domain S-box protein [Candidatus Bathyarchaeota archaeon]